MDSLQIQDLVKNDPYLKTKTCKIIYESEIPTQIDKDIILFVLIPNGQIKQKENKVRYALGHWCLIDTLKSVHHPENVPFLIGTLTESRQVRALLKKLPELPQLITYGCL